MFLELLLALFLACLLRWIYKLHSHSFPGPIGLPIIGSITLQSPDHHVLSSLHKTYGKTFQYSILGEDYICTMDTSLMKKVFRERENFPSSTHLRKALGHLTGPTMFLSEGKLWEARHQILRQFVTHQMIRENTSTIGSYVLQIFSFLKENQSINIGSLLHLFTFQVLGKILFNLNLNAIENQNLKIGETPILELPSVFNDGLMKRLNLPSFLWKFNSEIWKKEKNCFCELKKIFLNCVNEYLEDEKKNNFKNENRNDLLSILIKNSNLIQKDEETEKNQTTGKNEKIKKKETEKNENFEEYKKQNKTKTKGHNYSVNDILSELFSFFIAGETAHACQFLFYLISSNKKIQNKIQNEIDFLVQKNKKENEEFWIPEYENILDLKYMDRTIKECMRLFPIANTLYREVKNDILFDKEKEKEIQNKNKKNENPESKINSKKTEKENKTKKIILKKGQNIILNIFDYHRDEKIFFESEKFIPERWEKIDFSMNFTFGDGERKCIGQKFAYLEIKLIIFLLFRNFTFVVDNSKVFEITSSVGLMPHNEDEIWVIPTKRQI